MTTVVAAAPLATFSEAAGQLLLPFFAVTLGLTGQSSWGVVPSSEFSLCKLHFSCCPLGGAKTSFPETRKEATLRYPTQYGSQLCSSWLYSNWCLWGVLSLATFRMLGSPLGVPDRDTLG